MTLRPSAALTSILAALASATKHAGDRADLYEPTSHSIASSDLAQLEREVGMKLPNDVVVLAALDIPLLDRALGTLGSDATADIDEDEWALAWAGDPFAMHPTTDDDTYQQVADQLVCLRKDAPAEGDPKVLVLQVEEAPREMLLSELLAARLKEYGEALQEEDEVEREEIEILSKARATKTRSTFAVEVIADERPRVEPVRVKHAKFGAGTIIGMTPGSDVVEVKFDSGESRKLKRQFLQ